MYGVAMKLEAYGHPASQNHAQVSSVVCKLKFMHGLPMELEAHVHHTSQSIGFEAQALCAVHNLKFMNRLLQCTS